MKLFADFWKFTKIWKELQHRSTELFSFWLLDVENNFMFSNMQEQSKMGKNQKSTDKHSSSDGLIQEYIDLSDIYLAVHTPLIFHRKYSCQKFFYGLALYDTDFLSIFLKM